VEDVYLAETRLEIKYKVVEDEAISTGKYAPSILVKDLLAGLAGKHGVRFEALQHPSRGALSSDEVLGEISGDVYVLVPERSVVLRYSVEDMEGEFRENFQVGVAVGDVIALDPRTIVTESGYIRSRFLDDKLSAAMLLALAEGVARGDVRPARRVTLLFSVYEEVGHGASHGVPADAQDLLVVDMGCVGDGLTCTEQMVSICAKDSSGPFDYAFTSELIALAKARELRYAVDVYPAYASDAATARQAGHDLRCALIGAGVYASHGYERAHIAGVQNTVELIRGYVEAGRR
jgi:putative aminopeptidase FrvX